MNRYIDSHMLHGVQLWHDATQFIHFILKNEKKKSDWSVVKNEICNTKLEPNACFESFELRVRFDAEK